MDRRSFLKTSLLSAAAVASGNLLNQTLSAAEPAQKAVLRLCSQDGVVPGKSLKEKCEKLQKWGCWAVELGGSPNVQQALDAIKGTDLKISALCWGSHNGDLVSPDKAKQQKGIDDLKAALEKAGELQCTDGVIFVPTFNGQSKLKPEELDKVLDDILPAIGDYAQKCKTRVLLEPLTKGETYYINRVEQAAAICDRINNPGICLMGDFYHMAKEEKDQTQAFVRGAKWLHHVHLATRDHRIAPGQEPHSFIEGMKGLKMIGYQNTCSLECGVRGNRDEELPKVFDYLRKAWDEATI